jgi:hypothetical protein
VKFLVLGLALSVASQGTPRPGTLGAFLAREAISFAWPTGIVADVETEYLVEHEIDQAPRQFSQLRMTHQMRVLEQGDERLIHYTNQTRVESSGDPMPALGTLLPLWVPTFVVSDAGLLRRIEGAEQLRKLVTDMVEPLLANTEQVPRFRESLKFMTTEDGLYRIAVSEWWKLIGQWRGMSLTPESAETTGEAAIAPGMTVPTKVTVSVISRDKCTRALEQRDCVTYEYRSRIDRAGLDAAMKSILEGATARPNVPVQYRDYEEVMRVTLETKTMLPHDFIHTRTMHGMAELNGRSSLTTDKERRRSQFTYVKEP